MTCVENRMAAWAQLRQNQSAVLNRVSRENRILVTSRRKDHREVYLVDQKYLDHVTRELESLGETLDILMDRPLASRLLRLKNQFKKKPSSAKLVPFDEAFSKL